MPREVTRITTTMVGAIDVAMSAAVVFRKLCGTGDQEVAGAADRAVAALASLAATVAARAERLDELGPSGAVSIAPKAYVALLIGALFDDRFIDAAKIQAD